MDPYRPDSPPVIDYVPRQAQMGPLDWAIVGTYTAICLFAGWIIGAFFTP